MPLTPGTVRKSVAPARALGGPPGRVSGGPPPRCQLTAPPTRKEREKDRAPVFVCGESMGQIPVPTFTKDVKVGQPPCWRSKEMIKSLRKD